MHRKQIRRRRATALGLIALSFVLLTIYFGETTSGVLHSVQRGAMEVVSPLQDLASGAIKPARDLVNWFGDSFEAKDENEQLERDLRDARLRLARLEQAAAENEQLRALTDFRRSEAFPDGMQPVTARVIVRSPTEWFGRVTIDKGKSSGIRVNQPVIANGALAGRVTSVSGHAAQITLLTDSSSGVAGMISGKRIVGVVRPRAGGEAAAGELMLGFIRQTGTIREGNMVVTAGTVDDPTKIASLFPAGIPIGRVAAVNLEERELYGRVRVEPFVDMQELDIVQVLTRRGGRS